MPDANITKLALADSLKKLMAKKAFNKINVRDIAKGSGLTRQSFYYHFKDKYDLMNWIYITEFPRFLTSSGGLGGWTGGLTELCRYMQTDKPFYKNALATAGQNSFPEFLVHYLNEACLSSIKNRLGEGYDREKWGFFVSFFSAAFVAFLVRWAKGGMKEDPSDYINQIRGFFDGTLLCELEKPNRRKGAKRAASQTAPNRTAAKRP